MKKIQRERWIKAVVSLRRYYERKNNKWDQTCPLCMVAKEHRGMNDEYFTCSYCLWRIFDTSECGPTSAIRRYDRDKDWTEHSIKRLKRWERKLKEMR